MLIATLTEKGKETGNRLITQTPLQIGHFSSTGKGRPSSLSM